MFFVIYKSYILFSDKTIFFKERDIWWASIGINVGCEMDGKHESFERSVLIYRKISPSAFWAIPLSTQEKENRYYIKIDSDDDYGFFILSQIRMFSTKRLLRKLMK